MKVFGINITRANEDRAIENPNIPLSDPRVIDEIFGVMPTDSGEYVSEMSAMQLSVVSACVRVLSESVASLPLMLYRRVEDGKEKAINHPLYNLLHTAPSEDVTSYTFRELLQARASLWGNGYAFIEYDNAARPVKLIPICTPVYPERKDNMVSYLTEVEGVRVRMMPSEVLHIQGLGFDGLQGYNPIAMARQNLGAALATQKFGAAFFKNGARLSGVLEHPGKLSDLAQKNLRKSWDSYTGAGNSGKTAILEEGMKYSQTGVPPDDAQFLETRQFQTSDIARLFRIPPHMVGDLDKATFSNIEHQGIEFVVHTLRPWLVRWEQELNRKLLRPGEQKRYFFEFNIDGLLRGDIQTRYEAYRIGRDAGFLSVNDIRALENMNAVENGDTYLQPLNMTELGSEPEPETVPSPETEDKEEQDNEENQRLLSIIDAMSVRYGRKVALCLRRSVDSGDMSKTLDLFDKLPADIARDFGISYESSQEFSRSLLESLKDVETGFDSEEMASNLSKEFLELVEC